MWGFTTIGMSALKPTKDLYIYGTPTPAQVELIKQAKRKLTDDFFVQIVKANLHNVGWNRVLAFGRPDFVVEYTLVTTVDTLERMLPAMSHVLGLTDSPRATTVAGALSEMLGAPVVEVPYEAPPKKKPTFGELFKLGER